MSKIRSIGKFIINNKRLIFIFFFAFCIYEFISFHSNNGDPIAMYSFSHAIKNGEIPYKDFNIISTPLYTFIMSIGLFVFDNYIVFIFEQSILVTILFYFIFKILDKKAWIFLFGICLFSYFGVLPTYNFLCFLFLVIIYYLEKEYPDKDFLIGLMLGFAILSKHTVGLLLCLCMVIVHFKDYKKIFRRISGIAIPCIIFLIYLIVTKSLYQFINLSFLGLFDFGSKNSNLAGKWFIASLILIIIMFCIIIKHPKAKYNYYLLCSYFFAYPLYDINHFSLLNNCFMILVLGYLNIKNAKYNNYIVKFAIVMCFVYSVYFFACILSYGNVTFFKDFNHYQFYLGFKSDYDYDYKVNKILDKYKDKNMIILSGYTMFYDVIRDRKINYYDVLLYGNHGYNGTEYMIDKINKEKDVYIIVDARRYEIANKYSQYNKEIVKYVMKNYTKIDSKGIFNIYYKK